jgi:hypothetical protein
LKPLKRMRKRERMMELYWKKNISEKEAARKD